jgi:UDP-N-acetylmuramoylalanine--D-glutamate ligase
MDARWYDGRHVLVAGAGVSGVTVTKTLLAIGAKVTVVDRNPNDELADLGAAVVTEDQARPDGLDQAIVSPGFSPSHPLVLACQAAGLEVFSEPELAWRLRPENGAPWLAVTGTNGKTTTVTMLASILGAAGLRTIATGNIGYPLLSAVLDADPYDVLAVELSSFQLHWSSTLAPHAGALLNLADDHLEWHGDFGAYSKAKSALWRDGGTTAVGNLDDERVAALLAQAAGPRKGFRLGVPGPGELGVVEDLLVDRAFTESPGEAFELGTVAEVSPPGSHNVANALAAAALARSHGVAPEHVAEGIRGYTPEPHRNAKVATVGGVDWVDDSKATNPHAAAASLTAYPRLVWVAGGQLKGVDISDLVRQVAGRLAGAVLLGVDRAEIADALRRHAPDVPVVDVASTDDGAMSEVVAAAARLAAPGDTVLLAPAAASKDMYSGYSERGKAFAAAVRALKSP